MQEIPDAEILRGFASLLTGDAKIWFNASRQDIDSFAQLKEEMKAAFAPGDNEENVLERIAALKQRADETYVVFEARMQQLFRRLSEPLSESQKVKKVLNGLHSYYRKNVRSADVKSLRDLKLICGRLEPDKQHILKLDKEEEKKKEERRVPRVHAVSVEDEPVVDLPEVEAVSRPVSKPPSKPAPKSAAPVGPCWRCGQPGHLSNWCNEKIQCINCGAPDTIVERCDRCQQGSIRRGPARAQGNEDRGGARGGPAPAPVVFPHTFMFPPPGYPPHQNFNRRF